MVSQVQNLDERQSYCVTAHYHMQSTRTYSFERASAKMKFNQHVYAVVMLYQPVSDMLPLGNASYRTLTRFPWPLSTHKAEAYVYKNTVIHSKTIKIDLQCLLEARMAYTLAAHSLWQSTVTWQHWPKIFYNGREGCRTNHTTHTIIPATNSFCLCNFMGSKWLTQKGNVDSVMFWDRISNC